MATASETSRRARVLRAWLLRLGCAGVVAAVLASVSTKTALDVGLEHAGLPRLDSLIAKSPYDKAGVLVEEGGALSWKPFEGPPAPVYTRTRDPDKSPQLAFLHDRFVVFIGDSVERFALESLCSSFNGSWSLAYDFFGGLESSLVGAVSPASTKSTPDVQDEATLRSMASRSVVCDLPTMGTTFILLMTFGVVLKEETVWDHKGLPKPRLILKRLHNFADVLERRSIKTDAVFMSSALWDLAAFNLEEAIAGTPARPSLDSSQVQRYHDGLSAAIPAVKDMFHAPVFWKTLHEAKPSEGIWYLEGLNRSAIKPIPRQPYSQTRTFQLDEAARNVARSERVPVLDYARVMTGQQNQLLVDEVHPGPLASELYINMVLFHLERLWRRRWLP